MSENPSEFCIARDNIALDINEAVKMIINERDFSNSLSQFSNGTLLHIPTTNINSDVLICKNSVHTAENHLDYFLNEEEASTLDLLIQDTSLPVNNDLNLVLFDFPAPPSTNISEPQTQSSEEFTLHSNSSGQIFLLPSSNLQVLADIPTSVTNKPIKPKWPPPPNARKPTYCYPPITHSKSQPFGLKFKYRKAAIDPYKSISFQEFKSQLQDTSDILRKLQLAPPNKKSLKMIMTGGIEKLFAHPGRPILNKRLKHLFSRHLIFTEQFHTPTPDLILEEIEGVSSRFTLKYEGNKKAVEYMHSQKVRSNCLESGPDVSTQSICSPVSELTFQEPEVSAANEIDILVSVGSEFTLPYLHSQFEASDAQATVETHPNPDISADLAAILLPNTPGCDVSS